MNDLTLEIENIRCFAGKHSIELKPLTLVLGENSSGKTTILASLAALQEALTGGRSPWPFNIPPYEWGDFQTTVARPAWDAAGEPQLSLGVVEVAGGDPVRRRYFKMTYANGQVGPGLVQLVAESNENCLTIRLDRANNLAELEIAKGKMRVQVPMPSSEPWRFYSAGALLMTLGTQAEIDRDMRDGVAAATADLMLLKIRSTSLAPTRDRPGSTYNWKEVPFNPEGRHTPYVLRQHADDPDSDLIAKLNAFGRDAELFDRVRVRKLGNEPADPFQILVSVGKREFNWDDVGYGVSQVLPILVECCIAPPGQILLLQEPEVDLHPQAQAALGSFFCDFGSVQQGKKRLIVETHSDFIIDRVRMEVASGRIPHTAVGIVFVQKGKKGAKVHHLSLDEIGNLEGVPRGYRNFFLHEELRLLHRTAHS